MCVYILVVLFIKVWILVYMHMERLTQCTYCYGPTLTVGVTLTLSLSLTLRIRVT